jgi:hypothetical protein
MPAPPMPMDVQFGPLDTKTDPYALPPGYLTVAENATIVTPKSYTTRRGYAQLTTSNGPAAAVAALLRGTELLVCDGQQLWSYDANGASWPAPGHGQIPETVVTRTGIGRDQSANLFRPTVAIASNGVMAIAWVNGTAVVVTCYDANGQVVCNPQTITLSQPANIRLVANGTSIVLFTLSTVSTKIQAARLDASALPLTWSAASTISTNVHATSVILDACSVGANITIIWANTTGITVGNVNPTTLALGTNLSQVAALNASSGGGVFGTAGENVFAAWWDTAAGLKTWVLTTAIVAFAGPTVTDAFIANPIDQVGFCRVDSTHVLAAWERTQDGSSLRADGRPRDSTRYCTVSNALAFGTVTATIDLSLVGKPFTYNGFYYLHTLYDSTVNQPTNFLLRVRETGASTTVGLSIRQPVAMGAYRQAARDSVAAGLTDIVTPSAGVFSTASLIATKYLSQNSTLTAVDLVTFSFVNAARFQSTQLGSVAHIAASPVAQYDGVQVTETQFTTFPEGHTLTAATAGGSMADGTYQYILVYEWTDAFGNTHQSTTSLSKSVTISGGGGAGKVTIGSIPGLPHATLRNGYGAFLTGIPSNYDPSIVTIFRTAPSLTTGIYYSVASLTVTAGGLVQTLIDTSSDSTISSHRQVYITGGVLDKECPLPCSILITHQNALWGVSSEDPQLLFYSGDYFPGVAPWFSSGFQIRCDTGGAITALASLDDKVIVFKSDRIFYVSGTRPNSTGTGSSLSNPQLISTDVGCIEPRSIVRTGDGVYFLSQKGIYLLDRGLNVSYIGAPVEGYVSHYGTCTAATLMPDLQEIRWEFTTPDGLASWSQVARKVVYNYFTKAFTTHLNYNSLVPVTATGGIGVRYTWFTSAGVGYQELAASSQQVDPATTFIPMTVETGWLAPTGPQGLTRLQYLLLLGQYVSNHAILIELARNYVNSYAQSVTFANAIVSTGEQVSYNPAAQQGESYRVRVSTSADGASGGYGQSAKLMGLRLVALAKRGSFNKFMAATSKG